MNSENDLTVSQDVMKRIIALMGAVMIISGCGNTKLQPHSHRPCGIAEEREAVRQALQRTKKDPASGRPQ